MGLMMGCTRRASEDPTPASSFPVAGDDQGESGDDEDNWTFLVQLGINKYVDVGSKAAEVVQDGAENVVEDWLDTPSPSVPTASSVHPKTVPDDPPSPSVPTAPSVHPKTVPEEGDYCPLCDQMLGGPAQWEDHRLGKKRPKNVLATLLKDMKNAIPGWKALRALIPPETEKLSDPNSL